LPTPKPQELHLDGGEELRNPSDAATRLPATAIDFDDSKILARVSRVVFISVPQYGTNIADWVRAHAPLRRVVIEDLSLAVKGASIPPLERALSGLLDTLGKLAQHPDLELAAQDALNEMRASRSDPVQRAYADEAGSQLRLWLQHSGDDFGAIADLASFTRPPQNSTSPAHYDTEVRDAEIQLWRDSEIETMSIATIGRRAFDFEAGEAAETFDLTKPSTWPNERRSADADQMDISYLLTYRACAGGPFEIPPSVATPARNIGKLNLSLFEAARLEPSGPNSKQGLAIWDNDGIVNTASMLWPNLEATRLVAADHLDIVGHYVLRETRPSPDYFGRRYASYDSLKSHTHFNPDEFDRVWKAVFDFCVS